MSMLKRKLVIAVLGKMTCWACVVLVVLWAYGPAAAQEIAVPDSCKQKIRIGVLTIDTGTGDEHKSGIQDAVKDHDVENHICLIGQSYGSQSQGIEALFRMIRDSSDTAAHIILGPTESGVFVNAVNQEEDLAHYEVPVISGLVVANVANREDGWFFRTNVDVTRRVTAISDQLNKDWIGSVAVLYSSTSEFARRAQIEFEKELTPSQKRRSQFLGYVTPPGPRPQLRQILDERPEAVGFFGEREDIKVIYRHLRSMNREGTPYTPLFFTIIDSRSSSTASIEDIYFVSVTPPKDSTTPKDSAYYDIKALGYDTALLTLTILKGLGETGETPFDPVLFRKKLVSYLYQSDSLAGSKTALAFNRFQNTSPLKVYRHENGVDEELDRTTTIGWIKKLKRKWGLITQSYGMWPYISVALLLLMAFSLTYMDIHRGYAGSDVNVFMSPFFWLFLAGHFFAGTLLYFTLAETGGAGMRYDGIVTVFVIGLAPTALLRSTFFETPQGKQLGLERLYNRLLLKIDEALMKSHYDHLNARINVIAYYNSEDSMRKALHGRYGYHSNTAERGKLIRELEEAVRNENYFNRRRLYARRLLRLLGWEKLKSEDWIPPSWDQEPIDPARIVRMAARRAARDETKIQAINDGFKKAMEDLHNRNKERHEELLGVYEAELKNSVAVEGELNVKIRFLFLLEGFDIDAFHKKYRLLTNKEVAAERQRVKREVDVKRSRSARLSLTGDGKGKPARRARKALNRLSEDDWKKVAELPRVVESLVRHTRALADRKQQLRQSLTDIGDHNPDLVKAREKALTGSSSTPTNAELLERHRAITKGIRSELKTVEVRVKRATTVLDNLLMVVETYPAGGSVEQLAHNLHDAESIDQEIAKMLGPNDKANGRLLSRWGKVLKRRWNIIRRTFRQHKK